MVTEPATSQVTAGSATGPEDVTRCPRLDFHHGVRPSAAAEVHESLPGLADTSALPSTLTGFCLLETPRRIQKRRRHLQTSCSVSGRHFLDYCALWEDLARCGGHSWTSAPELCKKASRASHEEQASEERSPMVSASVLPSLPLVRTEYDLRV